MIEIKLSRVVIDEAFGEETSAKDSEKNHS
jgi:hypothetical protein